MIARLKAALVTLTPMQAAIVSVLFIASLTLAVLALWGFTRWNRRMIK